MKAISPSGAPSVAAAHSLAPSGSARSCAERISDVHKSRVRQARCRFRHPLVTLDPAQAFLEAAALALRVLGLTRPHPRVEYTQRHPLRRHRIGRMQIHPALHLVRQWPRHPACRPLKSTSVVSCRHNTTDRAAIRCSVCRQCGSRIALHSTSPLSKKRYAAIVSPQPRHACATPAVGLAANRSINVLARLFRRASPRSRSANSVSVQHGASRAKAFTQQARVNATRRKFTSPRAISLLDDRLFRPTVAEDRLVYKTMPHPTQIASITAHHCPAAGKFAPLMVPPTRLCVVVAPPPSSLRTRTTRFA